MRNRAPLLLHITFTAKPFFSKSRFTMQELNYYIANTMQQFKTISRLFFEQKSENATTLTPLFLKLQHNVSCFSGKDNNVCI